jgi:hypothetical protein
MKRNNPFTPGRPGGWRAALVELLDAGGGLKEGQRELAFSFYLHFEIVICSNTNTATGELRWPCEVLTKFY